MHKPTTEKTARFVVLEEIVYGAEVKGPGAIVTLPENTVWDKVAPYEEPVRAEAAPVVNTADVDPRAAEFARELADIEVMKADLARELAEREAMKAELAREQTAGETEKAPEQEPAPQEAAEKAPASTEPKKAKGK